MTLNFGGKSSKILKFGKLLVCLSVIKYLSSIFEKRFYFQATFLFEAETML